MEQRIFDEMVATRRALHRRPEEGWTEFETTWLIAQRLRAIGYTDLRFGLEIIDPKAVMGRSEALVREAADRAIARGVPAEFIAQCADLTGCVAVLATGRPGPVTAFRFDIDCVIVQETADPAHRPNAGGFASERPGLMHACGHDGHTAVGLAVARWLFENREQLRGTFKLVFQPAEEGVRGAAAIAASGILDDVDTIIGSHVGGKAGPGEIALMHGGCLASTKFDVRFQGQASHAGNAPHKGRSALMAACAAAMMLAGIPRHADGASRIAVGKLVAGEGRNVTPVHAVMQCEVRGETAEINAYMAENLERMVRGCAQSYGVACEIEKAGEATTLIECPEVLEVLREAAGAVPGVRRIFDLSSPGGSEDFTVLLRRVVDKGGRGAMFRWGCSHHGHHKGDFDLQDTESMPLGFGVFIGYARLANGIQ